MQAYSDTAARTRLTTHDLKPGPGIYQSSGGMFDVLLGEDSAGLLIKASSSGDIESLRSMLSQPEWIKTASEKQHAIYFVSESSHKGDVREVMAMPFSNLERAVFKAAENDNPITVSVLLDFALQQGIEPSSIVSYWTIDRAIKSGRAAVLDALASVDRTVANRHLHHGVLALDQAMQRRQTEVVVVLLKHGADTSPNVTSSRSERSYESSLLSLSLTLGEGTRLTEMLLERHTPVARSGALHHAAELGRLDHIRLLMQHDADVNEPLTPEMLARYHHDRLVGRTPLHFAASRGHVEAMQLLESFGARRDVEDAKGKTPAQLFAEQGDKTTY